MNRQLRPLDLSGLAQFRSSSLLAAPNAALAEAQETALDLIDFDPAQPRRNMVEDSLKELAASIEVHGVLEPVSLRLHPQDAGRYVVNRGERRVRASRMAGKASIPAFLDARVDPFAQAVENLHREDMSPFDLCTFIVEREREGMSRADIARRLVKSKSHITLVASLHNASPDVRRAFEEGRIRDVRALYELTHAAAERPEAVRALLASGDSISRSDVRGLQSGALVGGAKPQAAAPRDPRPGEVQVPAERSVSMAHLLVQIGARQGRLNLACRNQIELGEVAFEDGSVEFVPLPELLPVRWG